MNCNLMEQSDGERDDSSRLGLYPSSHCVTLKLPNARRVFPKASRAADGNEPA